MKIYLSEPLLDGPAWVDDLAEMPEAAPAAAPRPRRRLRNWHKFALCYLPIVAVGTWFLHGYAGMAVALVALAIWLATMLIILTLAGRAGRL